MFARSHKNSQRNVVINRGRCADVVSQGRGLSDDGRHDVTGSPQEVFSVEGSVLSLDLELVDLRQESVNGIGPAENTEQVGGADNEVLELREGLGVDHEIASLDWLIGIETGEDLTVFEEEVLRLSLDVRLRDVAGEEVLQPLDPGGEVFDVLIQPGRLETTENLGTQGVEIDGIPLAHGETD